MKLLLNLSMIVIKVVPVIEMDTTLAPYQTYMFINEIERSRALLSRKTLSVPTHLTQDIVGRILEREQGLAVSLVNGNIHQLYAYLLTPDVRPRMAGLIK
jgi:hypothetical protein